MSKFILMNVMKDYNSTDHHTMEHMTILKVLMQHNKTDEV